MTDIVAISAAEKRLALATEPEQAQDLELFAELARCYAEEQDDYEMQVRAVKLLVYARRTTTALFEPYITRVGSPMSHARTLTDFSLTRQEYARRLAELNVPEAEVEAYFDECIQKGWNPSIIGVVRYHADKQPDEKQVDAFAHDRAALRRLAFGMVEKHADRLTDHQRRVLIMCLDAFQEVAG